MSLGGVILFRLPAHLCFKAGRRCCTYFVNSRDLTIRSSRARFAVSGVTGPHRAGRLNSGVRPQNQRSGQKSSSRNFLTTGGPPTLEQPRPVSGIAKTRYASAVGCGFTQAKALSVPGLPGQKSIAFSGLTIRSSRDRCAASAKSRRIVTLPWPRSGPA